MYRSIMAFLMLSAVGFAQETWNGLKFGMSLAECRQRIAEHSLTLEKVPNDLKGGTEWLVKPGWDLNPPNSSTFHFDPHLVFSESGTLEVVKLTLRVTQHETEGMDPGVLLLQAAPTIQEQLAGKYGSPTSKMGVCDKVSSRDLIRQFATEDCKVTWKDQGQTVTLSWMWVFMLNNDNAKATTMLDFHIDYRPTKTIGL